jgi:hypothetical protein
MHIHSSNSFPGDSDDWKHGLLILVRDLSILLSIGNLDLQYWLKILQLFWDRPWRISCDKEQVMAGCAWSEEGVQLEQLAGGIYHYLKVTS